MPTRTEFLQAARNAERANNKAAAQRFYELAQITPPDPEMVAGNTMKQVAVPAMGPNGQMTQQFVQVPLGEEELAAGRARNMQLEMGLKERVVPVTEEIAPISLAISKGFSPTPKDYEKVLDLEYGNGNWINLGDQRYLVRTGNGKDSRWVLDNPVGLNAGDIAELAGQLPQLTASLASTLALAPGVPGSIGKLAVASGVPAAVSAITGSIQDALVRFNRDMPIDPAEIAARRGTQAGTEFGLGMALPVVGGKIARNINERSAVKQFYKAVSEEGAQAEEILRNAGVDVGSSKELGQAIRQLSPAYRTTSEIGDRIVGVINAEDRKLANEASLAISRAGQDASARAMTQIELGIPKATITLPAPEVGLLVQSAADNKIATNRIALDELYKAATDEIMAAAEKTGVGTDFVKLNSTKKAIDTLRGSSLKSGTERIPMSGEIEGLMNRLASAADTPQSLQAARAERTRIGEFTSGAAPLPPGMSMGVAKQIYKALSEDIDASVAKLSGPGAAKLQQFNQLYKQMMDPIEESAFTYKLLNQKFNSPEEIVKSFASAGSNDFKVAQQILPPKTFDQLRRATVDAMRGDATLDLMGRPVINVPQLVRKIDSMDPTVANELLGGKRYVDALRSINREYSFISSKGGLFTKTDMPSVDELIAIEDMAKAGNFDKINPFIRKAIDSSSKRRTGMGESLIAQARNGNTTYATRNPEEVLDTIVFNDKIRPEIVTDFLKKLPAADLKNLGDRAFQQVFEKARTDISSNLAKDREMYDLSSIVRNAFGSPARVKAMTELIGEDRMNLLDAWVRWDTKLAIEQKKKGFNKQQIANLVATLPYPNLFAARATSMALNNATGMSFIKGANPANVVAFPEARRIFLAPTKSAKDIVFLQQAINTGTKEMFDAYNEMMNGLTPDQQTAVNQYLFAPRD